MSRLSLLRALVSLNQIAGRVSKDRATDDISVVDLEVTPVVIQVETMYGTRFAVAERIGLNETTGAVVILGGKLDPTFIDWTVRIGGWVLVASGVLAIINFILDLTI